MSKVILHKEIMELRKHEHSNNNIVRVPIVGQAKILLL